MTSLAHPIEAENLGPHRMRLRFDDGSEGELDFSGMSWTGMFEPLADPDFFARGRIDPELRTLVWPNGADYAPDALHELVSSGIERVPS